MTTAEKKAPPRDDLCRSVPFTLVRAADDSSDGLTFTGYGAVFNQPTRIDSWEGCFDEQIAPGAFRKSLRERTPKFQFDHGRHPLIGSVPIGTIVDIHEDERGLYVQARLGRHILIDLIREAISTGAIDGMSFRFSVVRDEWRDRNGQVVRPDEVEKILWHDTEGRGPLLRTLKEVRIAEVGPVVWPAYAGTSASVRSADEPIVIYPDRLHEPEQRKLLAEAVLRAEQAEGTETSPEDRGASDDAPQPTSPDEGDAGERSGSDTEAPQPTSDEAGEHAVDAPQPTADEAAGEHESETEEDPAPTDDVDAARAAEVERLYVEALNEVRNAREATPPMKGL